MGIKIEEIRAAINADRLNAEIWDHLKREAPEMVFVSALEEGTIARQIGGERIHKSNSPARLKIVRFLIKLEKWQAGRFTPGRKGERSRFSPYPDMETVSMDENVQDTESIAGFVEHSFLLRPGIKVKIELPINLKKHEAGRLAEFIQTLPF